MKKIILCAAVAVFGLTNMNAQDNSMNNTNDAIDFGLKAGVNFAKLTGDDVENADGRTGIHFGVVAEIPVSDVFSIQPEVLYSQQGLQEDFTGGEYKLKLDYINVPVFAKFYVAEGLALELGPQFGFNVSSKSEVQIEGADGEEISSIERDLEDSVEAFDFGAGAGVSYKFDGGVFLQARYVLGLTSVYQGSSEGIFQDDLNNSNLSVSLGYKF
ncbi:porin family protein [Lacinutrix neustonica]|uniref:Porin family protein n=1 Tax=Lacinutrix neustonica TaxID=2980107 RepID=A0A9E8SDX0_9FLAO|nr:porin family protein [Lacinutrix neustonica]WAC02883.1 porin family protein [Lacinutrix neustonica]